MQAIRKYKSVFGRNLYDTDETNSILEIMLALHCPMFEEMKSSILALAVFFKSSCSDVSHFDVGFILYFFAVQIQGKKSEMGME